MLKDDVARRIFQKYLRRGPDGEPTETISDSFCRVAMGIAAYDHDPYTFFRKLRNAMTNLEFLPNRPAWFGIGREPGLTSACTFLDVEDSLDSIMGTLRDAVKVQQAGGGVGWGVSSIRAKGSLVSSTGGRATGPLGFIQGFNSTLSQVQQGGHQMGANNVSLHVDHPDIENFVLAKMREEDLDQFNTNVLVTDKFMKKVARDREIFPQSPETKLMNMIIGAMWKNGGIGVQFIDTANKANTIPGHGPLQGTNPCSEFWMFDGESCQPSYINSRAVLANDGRVDWSKLADLARLATRCMDNLIDANRYLDSVPKLKRMATATRRMGVGPTGLADMLVLMGITYGSPMALALTSKIMEWILYHAMFESVRLAEERGPFPLINKSVFAPDNFSWTAPKPFSEAHASADFSRPELDWDWLTEQIKRNGIRNCGHTVIAPSSFGSHTMSLEGYGIEPIFRSSYNHNRGSGDGTDKIDSALSNLQAFRAAHEVSAREHVGMVIAAAPFVTESIAKTINLPPEASHDDIRDVIFYAWERNLKNLIVYRPGSREKEVLVPCVECAEVIA